MNTTRREFALYVTGLLAAVFAPFQALFGAQGADTGRAGASQPAADAVKDGWHRVDAVIPVDDLSDYPSVWDDPFTVVIEEDQAERTEKIEDWYDFWQTKEQAADELEEAEGADFEGLFKDALDEAFKKLEPLPDTNPQDGYWEIFEIPNGDAWKVHPTTTRPVNPGEPTHHQWWSASPTHNTTGDGIVFHTGDTWQVTNAVKLGGND